jgi:hypothetical protein
MMKLKHSLKQKVKVNGFIQLLRCVFSKSVVLILKIYKFYLKKFNETFLGKTLQKCYMFFYFLIPGEKSANSHKNYKINKKCKKYF